MFASMKIVLQNQVRMVCSRCELLFFCSVALSINYDASPRTFSTRKGERRRPFNGLFHSNYSCFRVRYPAVSVVSKSTVEVFREINSYVGWPLMGRHRAASSNYSLCSQAFATLHSLFVSCSFFIHFRAPLPSPFLPPVLSVWLCAFFFRPRACFLSFSHSSPFLLSAICFSLSPSRSWFSRMVCSFSLFPSLPFRLRFTVYHCRGHLFGRYSPLRGTFLSRGTAISVNFG